MRSRTLARGAVEFLIAITEKMESKKHFVPFAQFDTTRLTFALGQDRNGKPTITMTSAQTGDVALVTAPAVTMWPRVDGDGNFGTMWGPQDPQKAKYTLDLTDNAINDAENTTFADFMAFMDRVDDALLDFVTENQVKVLGRRNLHKDEVKMLQIRTVRPKYDKMSGALACHTMQFSTAKFGWNGMGGKMARKIVVCDHNGVALPHGQVLPGDVVAATIYANQVYTGVGGDKFGIHWSFQDVSVQCQRVNLLQKSEVNAFKDTNYEFAKPYVSEPLTDATYEGGQFTADA